MRRQRALPRQARKRAAYHHLAVANVARAAQPFFFQRAILDSRDDVL
jgi:hypothetical protein